MNPKDIPFAMGNIMAIYFLYRSYLTWPDIKWKDIAGLAAGIGIAIATRAGGLLLFAYMGLFSLVFLYLCFFFDFVKRSCFYVFYVCLKRLSVGWYKLGNA